MSNPKTPKAPELDVAANKLFETQLLHMQTVGKDGLEYMESTLVLLETSTNGVSAGMRECIMEALNTHDKDRVINWHAFYCSLIDIAASSLPNDLLPIHTVQLNWMVEENLVVWKKLNHRNEFLWSNCKRLEEDTRILIDQIATKLGFDPANLAWVVFSHPGSNEVIYRN